MSKQLLNDILKNLHPESDHKNEISDAAFDGIDVFVEKYFNEDFCQVLIDLIEKGTDLRKVARILDILVWSTPDNGVRLNRLTSNWLNSNDLNRIRTILFRKDWLPLSKDWNQEKLHIIQLDPELNELVAYFTNEVKYWKESKRRNMESFKLIVKKLDRKIYSN